MYALDVNQRAVELVRRNATQPSVGDRVIAAAEEIPADVASMI